MVLYIISILHMIYDLKLTGGCVGYIQRDLSTNLGFLGESSRTQYLQTQREVCIFSKI